MSLLHPIKDLLLAKKPAEAKDLFLQTLFSPEGLRIWHSVTKMREGKVPLLLGFIKNIQFSQQVERATVNLKTGCIIINPAFFCDRLENYTDCLFVLLHERMHVILKLLYGDLASKFKTKDFCNFWEDVFVNGSILRVIESDFHIRFYQKVDGFVGFLQRQEFVRWRFILRRQIANLSIRDISMREHILSLIDNLSVESWVDDIGFYDWMGIGILIEPLFVDDVASDKKNREKDSRFDWDDIEEFDNVEISDSFTKYETSGESPNIIVKINVPRSISVFADNLLRQVNEKEVPINVREDLINVTQIANMIGKVSSDLVGDILANRQIDTVFEGKTNTPDTIARKDLYLLSCGYCPVLWTKELSMNTNDPFVLYMDVSGSMYEYYDLVPAFSTLLHKHCKLYFQFNEIIVSPDCGVDPQSLFVYAGTGGTNYNVVADHILTNNFKDIIVITDNTEKLDYTKASYLMTMLKQLVLISIPTYEDDEYKNEGFRRVINNIGYRGKEIDLGDLRA